MAPAPFTVESRDGTPISAWGTDRAGPHRGRRARSGARSAALPTPVVDRFGHRTDDVSVQVYRAAGHEVFNETNRAEVVADLLTWLDPSSLREL